MDRTNILCQQTTKTTTSRKFCWILEKAIPKDTLCGEVLSNSFRGKKSYRAIGPLGMAFWLYIISGSKYLKASTVREIKEIIIEIEEKKIARKI